MTISTVALSGTLPLGANSFGPIIPPIGSTVVQLVIDRAGLALLTKTVDMTLELSIDGGLTWAPYGGCTVAAGTVMDGLSPLAESMIQVKIPPADANTRLRGTITTKEAVVTSVTVRTT